MSVTGVMRSFIAALLFGPGWVVAAGSEVAAPNEPSVSTKTAPVMVGDMLPAAMWPQMMPPVAMPQMYYWAPPPAMMWPVMPTYPAPMMMPPLVWVMVPVPQASLAPAGVDYGPVADTPVVQLPLPETAISPAMTENAGQRAAEAQAGNAEASPAIAPPGIEPPASDGADGRSSAPAAAELNVQAVANPANEALPDYGPVTPTPVVDLLALENQAAESVPAEPPPPASKPARKSATPPPLKPVSKAKSEPVKKLCWTKGVVAPCR